MKKPVALLATVAVLGTYTIIQSCGGPTTKNSTTDQDLSTSTPTTAVSSELTPDFPTNDPTDRTQENFDNYAWELFVGMNWPALDGERGVADTTKTIGDSGTVVWETFKTSSEVFLPGGTDPGPWNSGLSNVKALAQTAKATKEAIELTSVDQAVGGPLIDQDSQFVYYEMLMNQSEYDFVRTNSYYNSDTLNALTSSIYLPNESMEIKAAWKILSPSDNASRFHTAQATIDGNPTPQTVGLVGLHIIIKTPSSPQWVWATFEQVDNVSNENGTVGPPYNFFNPNCPPSTCVPNEQTYPGQDSAMTPTQVTRLTPISPSADTANAKWRGLLAGTVWENYQLITTQWPSDPDNPGNPQGNPTPTISANLTMETYIQLESSCMGCHSTARVVPSNRVTTDYSFLFLHAQ